LYRGGQAMPGTASPEQIQKQMAKWMNWLKVTALC
jgi:hypothetical protein